MNTQDLEDKLKLIMLFIIIVVFVGTYFGLSADTINWIIELLISIFIGILLSAVAGSLVEAFTSNFLKTILLNIPIYGDFSISITVFTIVTIIVKIWLFGF